MDYHHRNYLKDNDYTFINKKVKGRYQGAVVSHIDEYAIPKLVYGIIYVQDHINLGVDWYPGEKLEVVESHRDDWISNCSDKPASGKLNRFGQMILDFGDETITHQTKYGPTE